MTEKKKEAKLVYFEQLALFFFKKSLWALFKSSLTSDVTTEWRFLT